MVKGWRDAGGNRTHFDRVAAGCLAIWLQRRVVSSSGVEPDLRPSQGRVPSATPRGPKHPGPDSNRDPDLRRVRCCPLHHQDNQEPTAGFAPAWAGLRDRCLSVSSHIGKTLPHRVSGGNRTRRLDLHRVLCQPLHHRHHRSPSSPGWIRTSALPHVTGMSCRWTTGLAKPRPGFEPGTPRSKRGMIIPFTIGARAEGKGIEPSSPLGEPP